MVPGSPDEAVTAADIEAMTTWTLIRLGRHLERLVAEALRPAGLTPLQYGVLAQLSADPELTQAALARAVLLRPQSMQHQLDGLIAAGLVARSSARGRGRSNPVRLTDDGRHALRDAQRFVDHLNDPATLRLTAQEAPHLRRLAERLLALPDTGAGSPPPT